MTSGFHFCRNLYPLVDVWSHHKISTRVFTRSRPKADVRRQRSAAPSERSGRGASAGARGWASFHRDGSLGSAARTLLLLLRPLLFVSKALTDFRMSTSTRDGPVSTADITHVATAKKR